MTNERYSSIDQLRFIAAITVALSHLFISNIGSSLRLEIISSVAVEVFFIISGFVLAPQILRIAQNSKLSDYKIFLIRRWYRTIPLYLLSLLLTSIILNKIFTFDFIKYMFFIQNILEISVNVDYFSISWSLSVEEWFYVVFPLFLILTLMIQKNPKKNQIIFSTIIFILLIFFFRIFFLDDENWGSSIRRVVLFRLDSIAFGFLLYFLKDKIKPLISNQLYLFVAFIFFSIFIFKIMEINSSQNISFFKIIFHFAVAIWGSSVVLIFYLLDKKLKNAFYIKLNLFLGRISYSTYLFHLVIIYLITPLNFSIGLSVSIFILLQLTISWTLYYFFEEPILKLRPNYN